MERYPTLQLWVRHGDRIAIAFAAAFVVAGIGGAAFYDSWVWLAAAALTAPFGYLLIRGYAELVRLVTDMLLPK